MTPTGCDAGHVVTARVMWNEVCASRTPRLERLLVAAGGVAGSDTARSVWGFGRLEKWEGLRRDLSASPFVDFLRDGDSDL